MEIKTDSPELDPLCHDLATYLFNKLNESSPNERIVNTIRCYDAYNVPLQGFPLLKVFRVADTENIDDFVCSTQINIAYCIAFPDMERLPGVTRWVRQRISKFIRQYVNIDRSMLIEIDSSITSRYRSLYQLGQIIYQLDVSFSARENA